MLEAIFSEGITTVTVTGLTQWDYGRKLTIKGLSYTDNVEVHFSNNIEKEAVVMEVTKSGSDLVTEVPNVLLEKNHDITAWVYIDSGTSGETVRTINLKVKPRIKPADYISENNAGKVIDYVAKAEEYASSAQESAEIAQDNAEKVQANTDLVQDILANVPDFDSYEKLAEHNKLLYDGLYVKGETYSGIASNKGVKLHSVKGKTVQQTTNGYQLFDSSKVETKTSSGATVTNNNDGSFTISGSGNLTETFSNLFNYSKEESLKLLKAGIYKSNVENTTPQIRFGLRNASTMSYVSNKCITSSIKSITLTEEDIQSVEDGTNILSIGFYGSNNNAIVTGTVKPMVYIDGDGTWEQFTGGKPAPNPDYAMSIENVEISKIISHGRQLFDSSKLATKSQSGATVTNNGDGSFTISGSGNLTGDYQTRFVLDNETSKSLVKGGTINLVATSTNPYLFVSFKNNDGAIGEVNVRSNSVSSRELTNEQINSDGFYIELGFWGSKDQPIQSGTIKPMLYQDGDGTWEPFKHATVETSLTLAEGGTYENGQVTNNFVNENLGDLFATIRVSIDQKWYNPELSYSYELSVPKVKLDEDRLGKCTHFQSYDFRSFYNKSIETGIMNYQSYCVVNISKSLGICTTVEEFKEWIQEQDVRVLKKLATPTTEEFKVPTIPSYYPYTNVSTDCNLETEMTWKILADCDNSLKQEELEKRIEALEHAMLER